VRTFASLALRHPGFERNRALLVTVDAQRAIAAPTERVALYRRIREAVRVVPGVSDAAVSVMTPVGNDYFGLRAEVSGGAPLVVDHGMNAFTNVISPGWFAALGMPVLAGRDFSDADRTGVPLVAVVNETLARQTLGREPSVRARAARSVDTSWSRGGAGRRRRGGRLAARTPGVANRSSGSPEGEL
jgi:hypothetical protein